MPLSGDREEQGSWKVPWGSILPEVHWFPVKLISGYLALDQVNKSWNWSL